MMRPQRAPVNLDNRHKEDYIRLVEEEGESVSEATRIVARKYRLTPAHSRQAVHKMLHSPKTESFRRKIKAAVAYTAAEGDGQKEFSLDEGIDLMLKALIALKKLPDVEAERDKYKRAYEELSKKCKHQEQTFEMAQQGDIPSIDTLEPRDNPNLTYHI